VALNDFVCGDVVLRVGQVFSDETHVAHRHVEFAASLHAAHSCNCSRGADAWELHCI